MENVECAERINRESTLNPPAGGALTQTQEHVEKGSLEEHSVGC